MSFDRMELDTKSNKKTQFSNLHRTRAPPISITRSRHPRGRVAHAHAGEAQIRERQQARAGAGRGCCSNEHGPRRRGTGHAAAAGGGPGPSIAGREEREGRSWATGPVLEVGDEVDKWDPLGSERICRARLSEREGERGREDISHPELTGCWHVMPVWLSTSANVAKMQLKLLSAGIVVGVILKVIIR